MIYRKSAAADSSVLSHPITWLDERIFGWSRSASSSVWGAKMDRARNEPPTAPGSPEDSDGEEYEADVDYDDVSPWLYLMPVLMSRSSQLWISDVIIPPHPEAEVVDHTAISPRNVPPQHHPAPLAIVP